MVALDASSIWSAAELAAAARGTGTFGEAARHLAALGCPVFPCGDDKRPLVTGGFKAATIDLSTIGRWAANFPNALPAVPTGAASGLFVVDADVDRETGETLGEDTLVALGVDIDAAPSQTTRSGGRHLFFAWRDRQGNSVEKIGPKVDTRGDGGFIISWDVDAVSAVVAAARAGTLPPVPDVIIARLNAARATADGGATPGARERKYAEAALQGCAAEVASAGAGGRNSALNGASFRLGTMIGAGWLAEAEVVAALEGAADACGLTRDDGIRATRATIRSGVTAGRGKPHLPLDEREAPAPDGGDPPRAAVEHADGGAPLPLFPPLPPAAPFPVDALGPVLGRSARAIASKVQVPAALAAQSVLAVAALAAQAHADVLLPFGQTRPLSLFFVTIAASGDRKSTADNEALWPVVKREKALRIAHEDDFKAWRIAMAAWSAERKKIEAAKVQPGERRDQLAELGDEPERPLHPLLTIGDLTFEGLAKNWPLMHASLGIFTAEGGVFTGGHGLSDEAQLRTSAALSEVWDGKPIKRLRAGDGVSILPGRRLSLHLMVQHDAAAVFLANPMLRDQGLLSRVLVAAPDSLAGSRFYREPTLEEGEAIRRYGARILSLLEAALPLADGKPNELEPRALTIEPAAAALWRRFFDHVEGQCGPGGDLRPLQDFAAKIAEHAARIAGVLTIVEDAQAATIGADAMERATEIADFYLVEAERLAQAGRTDPKLIRAQSLLEWLRGRGSQSVTLREMVQLGPRPVGRTKAEVEEIVAVLIGHGWLREVTARPRTFAVMDGGEA